MLGRGFLEGPKKFKMVNERFMNQGTHLETMETTTIPAFLEKQLSGNQPPRCVDGRPSQNSDQGPQMLGGTLQIILLNSTYHDKDLDEQAVQDTIEDLHEMEIPTGAHRGSHAHGDTSDCGFADRMPDILKTAIERRSDITERLQGVYEANKEKFPDLSFPFEELIRKAYEKIEAYPRIGLK